MANPKEVVDIDLINEINVESILSYVTERMANGASYIDCILNYSETYDIDIEVIGEIVRDSPVLMSAVHEEAESLNLIEKINRLPV
jgi:PII-like signaling protein